MGMFFKFRRCASAPILYTPFLNTWVVLPPPSQLSDGNYPPVHVHVSGANNNNLMLNSCQIKPSPVTEVHMQLNLLHNNVCMHFVIGAKCDLSFNYKF